MLSRNVNSVKELQESDKHRVWGCLSDDRPDCAIFPHFRFGTPKSQPRDCMTFLTFEPSHKHDQIVHDGTRRWKELCKSRWLERPNSEVLAPWLA